MSSPVTQAGPTDDVLKGKIYEKHTSHQIDT
jgi:hypothetical protein